MLAALAMTLILVGGIGARAHADTAAFRDPDAELAGEIQHIDQHTDIPLPVRARHGKAIVRAEAGLDEEADRIAWRADDTFAEIAPDLQGLTAPGYVEIRLVHDASDMSRAAPRGAAVPPWAAGVAFPADGVVVVAEWRGGNRLDVTGTIDHELAHLALGAALGDRAPRWLHEGFAYLHSTDWSWDREQTLAGMAWFGSVIPLEQLEIGFPAEELPASRAYAESYDFVTFLSKRGRFQEADDNGDRFPFRQFLAEVARTGDLDLAAIHAYGRPLHDLFDEWRGELKQRYLFMPLGLLLLSIWLLAVLLLVLAWRRRRRQYRSRLAEWEAIERAARLRDEAEAPPPRFVDVVPIWAGPGWAPPGAPVSEPADAEDVDAIVEDDDDAPRPPPRPRPPRAIN
jgi:hypothetical protein